LLLMTPGIAKNSKAAISAAPTKPPIKAAPNPACVAATALPSLT
jgi:hypothetical protein